LIGAVGVLAPALPLPSQAGAAAGAVSATRNDGGVLTVRAGTRESNQWVGAGRVAPTGAAGGAGPSASGTVTGALRAPPGRTAIWSSGISTSSPTTPICTAKEASMLAGLRVPKVCPVSTRLCSNMAFASALLHS
jgi:hypothetical protein